MEKLKKILQEIETIKVGVNTECRYKCKLYDWTVGACMGDCEMYVKEKAKEIIKRHISEKEDWVPIENRVSEEGSEIMMVWITLETPEGNRFVVRGLKKFGGFFFSNGVSLKKWKVVAWKPYNVPEPYRKDGE